MEHFTAGQTAACEPSPHSVPEPDSSWNREMEAAGLCAAVGQAAEAVVITDAAGIIRYVNPAFSVMTGYSAAEALGQSTRLLRSERQSTAYYQDLWKTILDGRVWRGELTNRRKDGTHYTEEMTITPVHDERGVNTHFIAIKQDVTDRRAAEQARSFLASIVESTEDGVIGLTLDGRIVTWNRSAEVLSGYLAEEVLGKRMVTLLAPEYRERHARLLEGLARGERYRLLDSAIVRKNGERADVSISLSPIRNGAGEVTAGAVVVRDVTVRRRAERALRDSEERFRSTFEHAPVGVCLATLDQRILLTNGAFRRMLGYSEQELMELGWGAITYPEDLARSQQAYCSLTREGVPVVDFEKRYVHRDGHLVWSRIRISTVNEPHGRQHFVTYVEDIGERRQAGEILRLSEEKYRRLVDNLPDVIWSGNHLGEITYISPNLESVFGYTPEEISRRGARSWLEMVHPEDRDSVLESYRALFDRNQPFDVEFRALRKDGEWAWIHSRSVRSYEQEGVRFTDGVFSDVTARKQAGQALRASEEKYRALISNVPDAVWTSDTEGHTVFISPNCERIYGYTPEEICQTGSRFDWVHEEDRQRVREAYTAIFTGNCGYHVEYRIHKKDGQLIWVHDRALGSYLKGGTRYADGCVTDITERKLYAEVIERLQRRTELILNAAGEGIMGLDAEGRLTFVNPAAARMLGYAPRALTGRPLCEVAPHTRNDGNRCTPADCDLLQSLRDSSAHRGTGVTFFPRRGASFPVEYISTPKQENGKLVGAVIVFRDVTETKSAQERIAASLKEKDALLREIHHRVKNNLQIVCSLLKLNSRNLRDPEARHIFDDTQHRVKAMALVHETLYQSGDLAGINFRDYIPRLAEQLLRAYGLTMRQVALTQDVECAVLPIDIAIPCALILTELISNGAKHAFAVARSGAMRIAFHRRREPHWLLEVENSGGVTRSEGLPDHPVGGASFGLELVKLLADQLGGNVEIERGDTFRVSVLFPATEESGER